jgi:hypothetical protein
LLVSTSSAAQRQGDLAVQGVDQLQDPGIGRDAFARHQVREGGRLVLDQPAQLGVVQRHLRIPVHVPERVAVVVADVGAEVVLPGVPEPVGPHGCLERLVVQGLRVHEDPIEIEYHGS